MKYIKSIKELFDSDELKSQMELDYLQDKIPLKDMVRDSNIRKQKDLLISKLLINCPYLIGLKYKRVNENLLTLGFDNSDNFNKEGIYLFFLIEIMQNRDRYVCNIFTKCYDNDKEVFSKKNHKGVISYDELSNFINKDGLDLLIDFTKFTEKTYNYKFFPYTNRSDVANIIGGVGKN